MCCMKSVGSSGRSGDSWGGGFCSSVELPEWWEALGPKDSSQGDPDRRGAPKPNGATSSNEDIRRSVDEEAQFNGGDVLFRKLLQLIKQYLI